jgi:WD40 repeat protein
MNFLTARPLRFLAALCLPCAMLRTAAGGEPPLEPLLRVDPGEHTATIPDLAADPQGRWLATVSYDKTLRIWALGDGHLLSTLRPPIGAAGEGELYAVAVSPDGALIAVGGWTQFYNGARAKSPQGHSIYFFDRASGRQVRRIAGLQASIVALAFSPDGRYLVAGLGDRAGVRIFDATQGLLLAEDEDYGGEITSVAWDADQRILTSSFDDLLRLYHFDGSRLTLSIKRAAPGGDMPTKARFSPDGRRIAVVFNDSTALSVVDGQNLTPIFSPDTSGLSGGGFATVAWSRDGRMLFASGQPTIKGRTLIRHWSVTGDAAGAAGDWPVAGNTIRALASLPGGRLAFASSEPSWGVLDQDGTASIVHGSPVVDFRNNLDIFQLSGDGAQFSFGYEGRRTPPVVFDVGQRAFVPAGTGPLSKPLLAGDGMTLANWRSNTSPTLNGARIKLGSATERAQGLAVLPDGSGFALATDFAVRLFAKDGSARWAQTSIGTTRAVDVSADGRWVVALFGDGTIHWFRVSDGSEHLIFYPHPDRKRWVLWTPGGYYDVSPGAEDLFGWQINRGKDSAGDFFPASRFRAQFYRPDIIAKVLEGGDQNAAVQIANQEAGRKSEAASVAQSLPPVLRILAPAEGSAAGPSVTLKFETRVDANAPVTGLRLRVNGLPVKLADPSATAAKGELTVAIPQQDSDIQLFAENRNGVSAPASVHVLWSAPAAAQPAPEFSVKPRLYVLAVGISNYQNPDYQLGLAAKDARDFVETFKGQKDRLYRDVQIKLLVDQLASRDNVLDGLDWLRNQVTAKDVGILFLAGHGETDPDGKYYFLPYDADADKLRRTGVVFSEIRDTLANLAGKALFFVDTCHSGNILGGRRGVGTDLTGVINELASAENGVVVFSSSTGRQYSLEDASWGNGAFTKAVVEGLGGRANLNKDGRITYKMLDFYVSERVKELTGGRQTPVTQGPGGVPDFPIALVN